MATTTAVVSGSVTWSSCPVLPLTDSYESQLAGGGAYDLKLYLWLAASMQWIPGREDREGTATVTQTSLLLVACVEETRQWRNYGAQGRPGAWREARDVIERRYGIHHDAVDSAKKELAHYGLLFFEFDELNDDDRFFNNAPAHTYLLNKEVWLKRPDEATRYEITYSQDGIQEGSTSRWMRLNQPHFRPIESANRKVLPLTTKEGRI